MSSGLNPRQFYALKREFRSVLYDLGRAMPQPVLRTLWPISITNIVWQASLRQLRNQEDT
jgi:hypothetical protein